VRAVVSACVVTSLAASAWGQASKVKPSQTPPPPSCLDRSISDELGASLRVRGVQKKTFLKKYRFEVVAHGGLFAADLLSTSYQWGGALAWFLTEDLGFETSFDVTPVALDLDKPVAKFFGDPRFEGGTGYLVQAGVLWTPIHFKLKTADGGIVHGDALVALSGGRLIHETAQGLSTSGGISIELFPSRWLSFRFDLRDVMLIQEAVAETRYTHNITALAGLGLWIPFGF
jgi:outer membrane beta-barrel protein